MISPEEARLTIKKSIKADQVDSSRSLNIEEK